jgi:hypothetical protein
LTEIENELLGAFSIGAIEKRETQDEKAPSREIQNENSAFSIGAPHGVPSAPSFIHNGFLVTLLLLLLCGVSQFRERVLFIGTQFSILYTSMYSPAEAATPRA